MNYYPNYYPWTFRFPNYNNVSYGLEESKCLNIDDCSVKRIRIKSERSGRYVAAEHGGGSYLIANREQAGGYEAFDLIPTFWAGPSTVALRTTNTGLFVRQAESDYNQLMADRTWIGPREIFKLYCYENWENTGRTLYTLKAHNGSYVSVRQHYALLADAPGVGPYELFSIESQ